MSHSISAFVRQLAETAVAPDICNPYAYDAENNAIRRHNLRRYLRYMQQQRPHVMLVAEAPGYRGCRLTGVPFSSPHFIRHGTDDGGMFGVERGYRPSQEWPHIRREASATIVWETLHQCTTIPLLWNAFPFHPHKPNQPQSNRPPRVRELLKGEPFVRQLQRLFPLEQIVAVGNKAESALSRWDIDFVKVRHPSQGGKADFQRGLFAVLGRAIQ